MHPMGRRIIMMNMDLYYTLLSQVMDSGRLKEIQSIFIVLVYQI